jgi:hypothetical protein
VENRLLSCTAPGLKRKEAADMKISGTETVEVQQYKGAMNSQTEAAATDFETKSFQNKIASAQTQLQKLSANNEMSSEEKAKKRQEIQKQIMELNNMLRERKAELRREKQQKAAEAEEGNNGEGTLPGQQGKPETVHIESNTSSSPGISSRHMKSVISADAAIDKAELADNISNELENRVQVLQGEIRQAEANGGYVEAKKGEVQSLENKVAKISGAKMNIISGAISEMKQAVKEAGRKDSKSSQNTAEAAKKPADVPSKDFTTKKQQVDMYTKGKMFSNVEFHF